MGCMFAVRCRQRSSDFEAQYVCATHTRRCFTAANHLCFVFLLSVGSRIGRGAVSRLILCAVQTHRLSANPLL
jgi:hypothetical protein